MKPYMKFGVLLAAGVMFGSAHAAQIFESTSGNLDVNLGADPTAGDLYWVLHTNGVNQSFTDMFDFSVTKQSTANAAYSSLAFLTVYNLVPTSFNLYNQFGTLIKKGSVSSVAGGTAGVLSDNNLAVGNYYYAFAGKVTGTDGGSYQFSEKTAPVPEPSTYALMLMGLLGVGYAIRQKKRWLPQSGTAMAI
jgi:hypothetical protein